MRAWFPDDVSCLDYLDWLRWPSGFVCPACSSTKCWELSRGERRCSACRRRVSRTAGSIFQDTRTPLTVWFAAAWQLTTQKNGISALGLKRVLGLGSYQTAWAMLHRYRIAMIRPGRDRLNGDVEVDEIYFGGSRPGKRGRGAGGKFLVAIAVEQRAPKGYGRSRMQLIPDAVSATLRDFLQTNVEPGTRVITDGLKSYPEACGKDYLHQPRNIRATGLPAHIQLPGVHRVASLAKRWLLGTHQGAVEGDHLQAYLNEFCFRFNRRHSRAREMLFYRLMQLAVCAPPITYRSLVVNPKSKRRRPKAPK
jgi:transposase-like protein